MEQTPLAKNEFADYQGHSTDHASACFNVSAALKDCRQRTVSSGESKRHEARSSGSSGTSRAGTSGGGLPLMLFNIKQQQFSRYQGRSNQDADANYGVVGRSVSPKPTHAVVTSPIATQTEQLNASNFTSMDVSRASPDKKSNNGAQYASSALLGQDPSRAKLIPPGGKLMPIVIHQTSQAKQKSKRAPCGPEPATSSPQVNKMVLAEFIPMQQTGIKLTKLND